MTNNTTVEKIKKIILSKNYDKKLETIINLILSLLNNVVNSNIYTENLDKNELLTIYKKRLSIVIDDGCEFGGLEETISVLENGKIPHYMITMDSDIYHFVFLINTDDRIIGSIYIEK